MAAEYKLECMEFIDKMSSHEYLMYIVLKEMENKEHRAIKNLMFEVLFGKPSETFIRMINESKEPIEELVEDTDGNIKYYNFSFKKVLRN
mgnify:CR=1 FL=1